MQLLIILLIASLIWFWWTSSGIHEAASKAAQKACEDADVQFLDGTVGMRKIRLQRNELGAMSLARLYSFEFSKSGNHRSHGFVVTLGDQIFKIELDNTDTNDDSPTLH